MWFIIVILFQGNIGVANIDRLDLQFLTEQRCQAAVSTIKETYALVTIQPQLVCVNALGGDD